MHHRSSGSPLVVSLLHRLHLTVRAAVVLAVVATVLAVPAGTATAQGPLAHEGAGIGTPVRQGDPVGPAPADGGDGPLDPADRDVLHKVKQAGLWEMPVGTWASERAESPRVREVGSLIAAEHAELDAIVNTAAARLGVELPEEPTPEQQDWMAEIQEQQGAAFDRTAVYLLRQAHGKVLPFLASIRAATENSVVRQFTTESMAFVQRHIEYLESTGLVEYAQLPDPAALGTDDWRNDAMTFVVFALLTALFTTLLLLVGRALAGLRRGRAPTPRVPARGHHARS